MKTLVLILAALAAAAAAQQPDSAAAPRSARHSNVRTDPNEVICRSEPAIGSRLRGVRRCASRAQWDEQRRLERQYAEKAQTNRTWCGGVCVRRQNQGR